MSLHYIIDGYNIVNHINFPKAYKKTQDHKKALFELIKRERLTGSLNNRITIVFDGYSDVSIQKIGEPDINVIFSRDRTADAIIKEMVEASLKPRNIAVVSDDKEIAFFIKSLGAQPVAVEEFIKPKEKPLGQKEDLVKPELNYSQVSKINKELKAIWLNDKQ